MPIAFPSSSSAFLPFVTAEGTTDDDRASERRWKTKPR